MRSLVALKILLYDRSTTIGAIIGVVAIVFLVGQQLSVLFGLFNYMSVLVDHSETDIWICSANTENLNSSGLIPERYLERVSALSEVLWAEPLLYGGASFKTKDGRNEGVQVVGIRNPSRAVGPWKFSQGSAESFFQYNGVTLDLLDLSKYGNPKLNDICEINGKFAKITAITQGIKGFAGRMVFTNIVKAREILNTPPGRCKAVLVKLRSKENLNAAVSKIEELLPSAKVLSASELSKKTRFYYIKNTGMGGSFGFSTLIGALVGIIIITLTMYTGVLQRQKDFAVLRALGARKIDIFVIVLSQAFIIAAIGIFIGFFLLALFLYATYESALPSYFPREVAPVLALATLVLCLGGSLLAVRKAISVEPASVFR